ncbi:MAG TPA: deoxyribose-phosphate aldolase, partial [Bacillota bacterium]|nr:deoxyribose-phosphate aldolase [Bacillota bacterium]
KDGRFGDVLEEIKRVKDACRGRVLKVIIECCLLTNEEKLRMCEIVSLSGADFIKTSTGFSGGGATREDVILLARNCAPHVKIKAAGGIRTFEDAADFIKLGASRIGSSALLRLAAENKDDGFIEDKDKPSLY